jgi:phenylacetic acid degradation operon negative regulatory protein
MSTVNASSNPTSSVMSTVMSARDDLAGARCSEGAPSARNLLVTVLGDTLRLAGDDAEVTVADLTDLLANFDVNERLVRTSLSRIAADGLVTSRSEGRRSYYRIADGARDLFDTADRRIYVGAAEEPWDGSWTIVVVDANEATSAKRAELRQQLTWAGLGTVAPNVMASPVVLPGRVADIVARVGGFDHVLVSRSTVVDGDGLLGVAALARRSVDLGEVERRYREFTERFSAFDDDTLSALDDALAFKLRTLLVATFRRIALADPQLPSELLPDHWIGAAARAVATRVYAAVATASDRHIARIAGLDVTTSRHRFAG